MSQIQQWLCRRSYNAGSNATPASPRRPLHYPLLLCDDLERRGGSQDLPENVLLGTKRLNLAFGENQNTVDPVKRFRTMRDDDDDSAAAAHTQYCFREGVFAVGIEGRRLLLPHPP